jgi:hypothetical protein
MKKTILSFLIFTFLSLEKNVAQTFQWAKSESYSSYNPNNGQFISVDVFKNIWVAGNYYNNGGYSFISKYDASGNHLWTRQFNNGSKDDIQSICNDSIGNLYVSMYISVATIDNITYNYQNGGLCLCFKLLPAGNISWIYQTRLGILFSRKTDLQGNLIFSGHFGDFNGDTVNLNNGDTLTSTSFYGNYFLGKMDLSGHFLWAIMGDGGSSPTTDAADNIYVKGTIYDSIFTLGRNAQQVTFYRSNGDGYFAKYTSTGELVWAKQLHGVAMPDNFGNVYTLETDYSDISHGSNKNCYLKKYDAMGNLLWNRTHIYFDHPYSGIIKYQFNNIYYSGGFTNYMTIDDTTIYDGGNTRMFLAKFDTTGNLQWITVSSGQGGAGSRDLAFSSTNEIYITGDMGGGESIFGNISLNSPSAIFITKVIDSDIATGIKPIKSGTAFDIYPNPTHTTFYITLPNTIQEPITINIYSTQGQLIYSEIVNEIEGSHKITLNALPGVYYLRAEGRKESFVEKLVVY